jgi:hypothetical protein
MKKQNLSNKLAFRKAAVTELDINKLEEVKGGEMSKDAISIIIRTMTYGTWLTVV